MKLYHGSNTIVKKTEILTSNRFLDFGNGFYTTANEEQARKFAVKVAGTRGGKAILNIYELDENNLSDLDVKHFKEVSDDWLRFVAANRSGNYNGDKHDLVIGAVANDDVFRTVQLFLAGLYDVEQTLKMLKIKDLYDQYVFTTDKAVRRLKYVSSEEV